MHRRSNLQCNQLYRDFSVNDFGVTGAVQCNTANLPQSMRPFSNRFCGNYDYTKNGLRTYGAYPTKTCSKLYKSDIPVDTKIIEETPATVTIQTTTPAVKVTEEPVVQVTEEPVVQITQDMQGNTIAKNDAVKVTEEPAVKVTEEKVMAVETFKTRKSGKERFTNGAVERLAPYPSSLTSYSAYPYVTLYDIPTLRPIPQYKLQQVPFYYADGVMYPATVASRANSVPVTPIIAGKCAGNGTLNPVLVAQERNFAVMPHIVPTIPMMTPSIGVSTRNNTVPIVYERS